MRDQSCGWDKECKFRSELMDIRFVFLFDIAIEQIQVSMALLGIIASDNLSQYTDDSPR